MPFSESALAEIWSGYRTVQQKYHALLMDYTMLQLASQRAREFATQGLLRRLRIMVRCIENVFSILPPEREDVPSTTEILNATINIQAFIINVFGCIDNLAWIWVSEKNLALPNGMPIPNVRIGLSAKHVRVRQSFSPEFQARLKSFDAWFEALGDFRDALAHRISPYIPPYVVSTANQSAYEELTRQMQQAPARNDFSEYDRLSSEQDKLGRFDPWLQHSFGEKTSPIYFHPQLLADFNTVEDIALKMLDELRG